MSEKKKSDREVLFGMFELLFGGGDRVREAQRAAGRLEFAHRAEASLREGKSVVGCGCANCHIVHQAGLAVAFVQTAAAQAFNGRPEFLDAVFGYVEKAAPEMERATHPPGTAQGRVTGGRNDAARCAELRTGPRHF